MRLKWSSTVLLLALVVLLGVFAVACGEGSNGQSEKQQQEKQQQGKAPREREGGRTGKGTAPDRKIALGKAAGVNPENRRLILDQIKGRKMSFRIGLSTKITLDNKEAKLSDVKEGQQARITYIVKNELNRAREVDVFSDENAPVNGESKRSGDR